MTGYEFELQRDRNERLKAQADVERLLNKPGKRDSVDLRVALGQQLVKLGALLAGDNKVDHAA